jgi:hypothetical protein
MGLASLAGLAAVRAICNDGYWPGAVIGEGGQLARDMTLIPSPTMTHPT